MSVDSDLVDVEIMLDDLLATEHHQSNCMFQLALMLARISLEPVSENYKDQMAQALLGLVRAKPKGTVVQLFRSNDDTPLTRAQLR